MHIQKEKKIVKFIAVFLCCLTLSMSVFNCCVVTVDASSSYTESLREIQEKIANGYYGLGDRIVDTINAIDYSIDSYNQGAYIKHTYGTEGYSQWKNGLVPNGNTVWTKPISHNTTSSGVNSRGNSSNSNSVYVLDVGTDNNRYSTIIHNSTYNSDDDTYNYSMDWYNPVTNNYTTSNEWNYYNEYNTYVTNYEDNDYYITNNYTYVSYTIVPTGSSTSVTGKTLYYEIYYQLSDGRNSYDLSYEDIWGTFFIYDVVNYRNVPEDNGRTIGLWHMDGDLKDSSFYCNSIGTSTDNSYRDGIFEYSKSLPSGSSVNNIILPIADGLLDMSEGFTLEFYQYDTGLSSNDMSSGKSPTSNPMAFWCNAKYYTVSSGGLNSYNHWVFQYDGVDFSIYLNGKKCTSVSNTVYSSKCFCVRNNQIAMYVYSSGANVYIDEVRLSKGCLYKEDFTAPVQPYTTNMVLVLPDEVKESDIAIKSQYPVSSYRIGGVKPTYPADGFVYIMETGNIVSSVQQYQSNGWYEVDGAIYIDGEWQELNGYDLSVCSIGDSDDDGSTDGTPDGTVSDGDSTDKPSDSDDEDMTGFLTGLKDLVAFILNLLGRVVSIVTDLGNGVVALLTPMQEMFSGFTGLMGVVFGFIPQEIMDCMVATFSAICLIALWRFFKGGGS